VTNRHLKHLSQEVTKNTVEMLSLKWKSLMHDFADAMAFENPVPIIKVGLPGGDDKSCSWYELRDLNTKDPRVNALRVLTGEFVGALTVIDPSKLVSAFSLEVEQLLFPAPFQRLVPISTEEFLAVLEEKQRTLKLPEVWLVIIQQLALTRQMHLDACQRSKNSAESRAKLQNLYHHAVNYGEILRSRVFDAIRPTPEVIWAQEEIRFELSNANRLDLASREIARRLLLSRLAGANSQPLAHVAAAPANMAPAFAHVAATLAKVAMAALDTDKKDSRACVPAALRKEMLNSKQSQTHIHIARHIEHFVEDMIATWNFAKRGPPPLGYRQLEFPGPLLIEVLGKGLSDKELDTALDHLKAAKEQDASDGKDATKAAAQEAVSAIFSVLRDEKTNSDLFKRLKWQFKALHTPDLTLLRNHSGRTLETAAVFSGASPARTPSRMYPAGQAPPLEEALCVEAILLETSLSNDNSIRQAPGGDEELEMMLQTLGQGQH
jgi:hypothetical protein